MSAYSLLRIVHSYWRLAVVILAIAVLVRSVIGAVAHREWTRRDDRTMRVSYHQDQGLVVVSLWALSAGLPPRARPRPPNRHQRWVAVATAV